MASFLYRAKKIHVVFAVIFPRILEERITNIVASPSHSMRPESLFGAESILLSKDTSLEVILFDCTLVLGNAFSGNLVDYAIIPLVILIMIIDPILL